MDVAGRFHFFYFRWNPTRAAELHLKATALVWMGYRH